jgi:hypothetical protein
MPDIVERLQSSIECNAANGKLLSDALQEICELRERRDALEQILIVLARTPLPWDEDGRETDAVPAFKERYLHAIHEASDLLGLERSRITRTEPRT